MTRSWSGPEATTTMNSAVAAMAPSFGPDARKAATSGRADSYASGAHAWNGTSELLNASAVRIRRTPASAAVGIDGFASATASSL